MHLRLFGLATTLLCYGSSLMLLVGCEGLKASRKDLLKNVALLPEEKVLPQSQNAPFVGFTSITAALKVKQLMHGGPLLREELTLLQQPGGLALLVESWLKSPQFARKMTDLFGLIFQQRNLRSTSIEAMTGGFLGDYTQEHFGFLSMLEESFSRTAWHIAAHNQPFSEVLTTQTYMLTPALAMYLAYLDDISATDNQRYGSYMATQEPGFQLGWQFRGANPRSLAEEIQTRRFYVPLTGDAPTRCPDPLLVTRNDFLGDNSTGMTNMRHIYYSFYGVIFGCDRGSSSGVPAKLTKEDHQQWRLITIRQPIGNEKPTPWYDLEAMRSNDTLLLRLPRVGFFTTPAFMANWPTNQSNQMRVTAQQTLIAALAMTFAPEDSTLPAQDMTIDTEHAAANTACYACHKNLDPLSNVFRQAYSLNYGVQTDLAQQTRKGGVFLAEMKRPVSTVKGLGIALAEHPRFPIAMVQHLCHYANAVNCDESDPVFLDLVNQFKAEGLAFLPLAKAFFQSPLVTGLSATKTFPLAPASASLLRANHFCHSLSVKLDLEDPCALQRWQKNSDSMAQLSQSLPKDNYSRGKVLPDMPVSFNLLTRASLEKICEKLVPQAKQSRPELFGIEKPQETIKALLSIVIGLPEGHPLFASIEKQLQSHYDAARILPEVNDELAIQSVFVMACTSPFTTILGL